jgi:hypothetical protein
MDRPRRIMSPLQTDQPRRIITLMEQEDTAGLINILSCQYDALKN